VKEVFIVGAKANEGGVSTAYKGLPTQMVEVGLADSVGLWGHVLLNYITKNMYLQVIYRIWLGK
jgi:hypothetical protein